MENFKLKFKSEELELQKYMIELQAKMKTDQVVDNENEQYLDYSIKVSQHTCTYVLYEYLKILYNMNLRKNLNQPTTVLFS